MAEKRERHILALSGGKDSAALAIYMREKYPEIPLEYVFTDSGCELPETYEYLDRIRAILNIHIVTIHSSQNFDYWLKYFRGVLPSPTNRWCTRLLKLRPYNTWLSENCTGLRAYSYVGLRADEDREGYRTMSDDVIPVHPFVDDGLILDDITRILKDAGLGLPGYYSWRQRSGCYFCFFQRDDEWRGLRTYHPELFEKACQYEEQHSIKRTYTWRECGYLRELAASGNNPLPPQLKIRPLLIDTLLGIIKSHYRKGSSFLGDKE